MVGETELKERPKSNPDYLMQLMNDRKVMSSLPNFSGIFTHLERLLDEEIGRVRKDMYNDTVNGGMFAGRDMEELPEAVGPMAQLQEKLYVPVKEYPDFNFVGRILGPRGLTAKQLEAETGCKIMVRGKGSMRDKKKCHLEDTDDAELCDEKCSISQISINTTADNDDSPSLQCTLMTESECWISFNVVGGETGITAYDLQMYGCPEPPNIPMIILGVSLSVVCIGLILLAVWKVLVSVHDRKEVAKFEAERSKAKWQSGTNPLFRSSTSTFKNVTYRNTHREKISTLDHY